MTQHKDEPGCLRRLREYLAKPITLPDGKQFITVLPEDAADILAMFDPPTPTPAPTQHKDDTWDELERLARKSHDLWQEGTWVTGRALSEVMSLDDEDREFIAAMTPQLCLSLIASARSGSLPPAAPSSVPSRGDAANVDEREAGD